MNNRSVRASNQANLDLPRASLGPRLRPDPSFCYILRTTLHVQDLFCTALNKWFDTGVVQIKHFHGSYGSYHDILILQKQIGWIDLFMGHWSSKWEALHDTFHPQENTASTWTASMIETGLKAMIQLWEQHNGDVYGKSKIEQKQKLLEHQKLVISDLLSKQHWCLPKDHFLFPSNPQRVIGQNLQTIELGNWILTRMTAILRVKG